MIWPVKTPLPSGLRKEGCKSEVIGTGMLNVRVCDDANSKLSGGLDDGLLLLAILPGTNLDFGGGDWVDGVSASKRFGIAFRESDVGEFAFLENSDEVLHLLLDGNVAVDASGLDPTAKKVRNLNKKVRVGSGLCWGFCTEVVVQLKAIEELKEKQKKGERLEATQLKKIETEAEIRKELSGLDISS